MIHFAPNSPWPQRLKLLMYVGLALVVIAAVTSKLGRRWVQSQGGDLEAQTRLSLYAMEGSLQARLWIKGRYPTTEEGVYSMLKEPKGLPVRIQDIGKKSSHLDGWKREFQYRCPGQHNADSYDLWSLGADGEDGTRDDITNW